MNTAIQEAHTSTSEILKKALPQSISYIEYSHIMAQLAEQGRTTGSEQSESRIDFTKLNYRRMKRWDKTLRLSETVLDALARLDKKVTWLVLTESWCGDAAPSLPVMHKMAQLNGHITLKILLRDDNVALMNRFLTRGAQSIPKLIAINEETMTVVGEWGPRPQRAAQMVVTQKATPEGLTAEFREKLQLWYNKNKGESISKELLSSLLLE